MTVLAPRLGPKDAEAAWQRTFQAQTFEVKLKQMDSQAAGAWLDVLASLARQLGPEDVSAAAKDVLHAIRLTPDPDQRALYYVLALLAPRLGPDDASAALKLILAANGDNQRLLELLAPRLGPDDASAALKIILAANGDNQRLLELLAPRLGAGETPAAVEWAFNIMGNETVNTSSLSAAATILAQLAPGLDPADASRRASSAAQRVLKAMGDATDAAKGRRFSSQQEADQLAHQAMALSWLACAGWDPRMRRRRPGRSGLPGEPSRAPPPYGKIPRF